MRAVIYARTSSSGLVEKRQCTDSQVAVLMQYAKTNNIEVVEVFEEHISGAKKNEERIILNECINYVKTNKIDLVLCYSLDRIGRSVLDVFEVIKWLADNKVNAYFFDDNMYMLDDNGEISDYITMIIAVKSLVSKIEKNNIKNRLNRGRKFAIENNLCNIGRPAGTKMTSTDREKKYSKVIKMLRKGLTVRQVLSCCKDENIKVGEATVWKLKKEFCSKNTRE